MKGIATDSCQWYNGYQQKSDDKPCFDTEFTKSLITLFFIHFSPRLFIHYTKKSQDNPSKTQIEKDCTYLSQENLYHIIFTRKSSISRVVLLIYYKNILPYTVIIRRT